MVSKTLLDEYNLIAQELFKKNFLNIGIGSLSLKLKADQMLINKKRIGDYKVQFEADNYAM